MLTEPKWNSERSYWQEIYSRFGSYMRFPTYTACLCIRLQWWDRADWKIPAALVCTLGICFGRLVVSATCCALLIIRLKNSLFKKVYHNWRPEHVWHNELGFQFTSREVIARKEKEPLLTEWIRSVGGTFHGLSHHLTLMLIWSLLSTMAFFTRMFSSFKSRCTISVRRSTFKV